MKLIDKGIGINLISKGRIAQAKNYPILDLAHQLGLEVRNKSCGCINPSHEDKHPSMSFDKRTNTFKCWVPTCQFNTKSHDTIDLVMAVKNLSFQEAINFILVDYPSQCIPSYQNTKKTPLSVNRTKSAENGEKYADIYEYLINFLPYPDKSHYLVADRKISLDVLKANNIKRLIQQVNPYYYLNKLQEAFPRERIKQSGIYPIVYDNNCCAVIPFYREGRIIYLQGIASPGKREKAKVRNLMGIIKPVIYVPELKDNHSVNLCEGIITALYMSSFGYSSVAIISGSDSTETIASNLTPFKDRKFFLCPDADKVGIETFNKIKKLLFTQGFNYDSEYFNPIELGRKLKLDAKILIKIKDLNDLRAYMQTPPKEQ